MKLGTRSLLFGVHQFIWHPVTVYRAWCALYGTRPTWREAVCIFVHDWGYWGCATMDGRDGAYHPVTSAKIAGWLLGKKYADLVLWHSRHLAASVGVEPSKLCWADKASMVYDPQWFYLLRARLSGEINEYRAGADRCGFILATAPDRCWHDKLVSHLWDLSYEKAKLYRSHP